MSRTSLRRLLLVEDNAGDARLLREMIGESSGSRDTELTHVESLREAERHLSESHSGAAHAQDRGGKIHRRSNAADTGNEQAKRPEVSAVSG